MTLIPRSLLLVLAGLLLFAHGALAQGAERSRITVASGRTFPATGYGWSASGSWEGAAHFHVAYERSLSRAVRLGGVASFDRQKSGKRSVDLYAAGVRGGYGGLEVGGSAFVPFAEASLAATFYRSAFGGIGGSTRLAPRLGVGVALRQRVWRGLGVTGEVGHQFVLDRFGQIVRTVVPSPGLQEGGPHPTFRYTEARLGVSWEF